MRLRLWLLVAFLTACSALPSPEERRAQADNLAATHDWQPFALDTGDFILQAYVPPRWNADTDLTVYLEGDGLAWLDGTASDDPTPRDPLALRLAMAHTTGNAAYLARPCQYQQPASTACSQRYWTDARFAPDIITATNRALDTLKTLAGARTLSLVGYSGGGAVAVLVAAQRLDVTRLITIAGNLDLAAWTQLHNLPPLSGSLDPVTVRNRISALPQLHFAGAQDTVVPPSLIQGFAAGFPVDQKPPVQVIERYDHQCCWVENWGLLQRSLSQPSRVTASH